MGKGASIKGNLSPLHHNPIGVSFSTLSWPHHGIPLLRQHICLRRFGWAPNSHITSAWPREVQSDVYQFDRTHIDFLNSAVTVHTRFNLKKRRIIDKETFFRDEIKSLGISCMAKTYTCRSLFESSLPFDNESPKGLKKFTSFCRSSVTSNPSVTSGTMEEFQSEQTERT